MVFEAVMIVAAVVGVLAIVGAIGSASEAWTCFWLAVAVIAIGVMFGAWSVIDRG